MFNKEKHYCTPLIKSSLLFTKCVNTVHHRGRTPRIWHKFLLTRSYCQCLISYVSTAEIPQALLRFLVTQFFKTSADLKSTAR